MTGLFDGPERRARHSGIWRVGTSGWSYPVSSGPGTWSGSFYPRSRVDELRYYAKYFDCVEVNSTFYRYCSAETAARWVEKTPDDFLFAVKAWRALTHDRAGWSTQDLADLQKGLQPIADAGKFGRLLFQFPSSFHHTQGNAAYLEHLLDLTSAYPAAVELRHASWNGYDTKLRRDAIPVYIDEPKFAGSISSSITARDGVAYVRLHGRRAEKWWTHEHRNERYDYLYSARELEGIASGLRSVIESEPVRQAYVFFNNHPDAKAVANAVMMRGALGIPIEEALPQALLDRYPDLRRAAG